MEFCSVKIDRKFNLMIIEIFFYKTHEKVDGCISLQMDVFY